MSNPMENKLEQFRKFVEKLDRKVAGENTEAPEVPEPTPAPAPAKPTAEPEPVAARIGPPLSQATGSVSQIDRSAVLTSTTARPESAPPASRTYDEEVTDRDVDETIPEVEDYMPWLKDEGTGEPKESVKVDDIVEVPVVEETSETETEAEAETEEIETRSTNVELSAPAASLTPRSYVAPTTVPSRDQVLPFEGTGDPRPILREDDVESETDSEPELDLQLQPEPELAVVEAAVLEPKVEVTASPAPVAPVSTPRPKTAGVAKAPARVLLKQPAAPPQTLVGEDVAAMWGRLPRHIQLLMGTQPKEVAQNSYKKFKETRDELVQRLLDPSLSLEEAARILNVCPTTVRRYTNRGVLPHFRTAGNQRRFRLSDVLAFLETMSAARLAADDLEEVPS